MKMRVRDTGEVVELGEPWNPDVDVCLMELDGFLCTHCIAHDGPHVAHGPAGGPLAFWNDGDTHVTRVALLEPTP